LGPANPGSALLKDLRDKERDSARNGASPA
jgi:hypothetical protein